MEKKYGINKFITRIKKDTKNIIKTLEKEKYLFQKFIDEEIKLSYKPNKRINFSRIINNNHDIDHTILAKKFFIKRARILKKSNSLANLNNQGYELYISLKVNPLKNKFNKKLKKANSFPKLGDNGKSIENGFLEEINNNLSQNDIKTSKNYKLNPYSKENKYQIIRKVIYNNDKITNVIKEKNHENSLILELIGQNRIDYTLNFENLNGKRNNDNGENANSSPITKYEFVSRKNENNSRLNKSIDETKNISIVNNYGIKSSNKTSDKLSKKTKLNYEDFFLESFNNEEKSDNRFKEKKISQIINKNEIKINDNSLKNNLNSNALREVSSHNSNKIFDKLVKNGIKENQMIKKNVNLQNNLPLFSSSNVITETKYIHYHNTSEPNGKIIYSAGYYSPNLGGDAKKHGGKRTSFITEQLEDAKKIIENIKFRKEFDVNKYFQDYERLAGKNEKKNTQTVINQSKSHDNQSMNDSNRKNNNQKISYNISVMDHKYLISKEEKNKSVIKQKNNNSTDIKDLKTIYYERLNKKPKNYIGIQNAKLGLDQKYFNNNDNLNNKLGNIGIHQENKSDDFSSILIKEEIKNKTNNSLKSSYYAQSYIKNINNYKEKQLDRSNYKRNEIILNGNVRNHSNNHGYMNRYKIKNGNPNNYDDKDSKNRSIKNSFNSQHKCEKTYADINTDMNNQKEILIKNNNNINNNNNNSLNNRLKRLFIESKGGEMINFSYDDFSIDNKILKYESFIRNKEKLLGLLQKIFEKEKFFMHKINETYFNCLEEEIKNKLIKILLLLCIE